MTGFTIEGEVVLEVWEKLTSDGVAPVVEAVTKTGADYSSPMHPFDDYSITAGRVITGANPPVHAAEPNERSRHSTNCRRRRRAMVSLWLQRLNVVPAGIGHLISGDDGAAGSALAVARAAVASQSATRATTNDPGRCAVTAALPVMVGAPAISAPGPPIWRGRHRRSQLHRYQ